MRNRKANKEIKNKVWNLDAGHAKYCYIRLTTSIMFSQGRNLLHLVHAIQDGVKRNLTRNKKRRYEK